MRWIICIGEKLQKFGFTLSLGLHKTLTTRPWPLKNIIAIKRSQQKHLFGQLATIHLEWIPIKFLSDREIKIKSEDFG